MRAAVAASFLAMARPHLFATSLPLALFCACASSPPLPDGGGPGIVAFDPTPPEGARLWDKPTWRVGDRFTLLRGGQQRIEFTVTASENGVYTLTDGNGMRMRRGHDLSNLGEWGKDGEEALHELTPADTRFHWPLWVGKRWRCQYSDRTAGGAALPIETGYEVEDLDTVVTPAGTFSALRVVRTSRLQIEGGFLDRVSVVWYAPEPGLEVRQVLGDTAVELLAWVRAESVPVAPK